MTLVEAMELGRYGVRANCLAPLARTRLTLQTPGVGDTVAAPSDGSFDLFHPGNVSPLVAYLAAADCPFTGGVFHVGGNEVGLYSGWQLADDAVATELLRYGQRVAVIAFACDPIWRTPRGIETAGPRAFGYAFDYVPVEALHGSR